MAFKKVIGQQRVKQFFLKAQENARLSHAYLFIGEKGVGKEAMALEFARRVLCGDTSDDHAECTICARITKLSHPDLHYIFPAPAKVKDDDRARIIESVVENPYKRIEPWANPTISIAQIRDLRKRAAFKSFEGGGRIVIIADCERMTTEAANSLLKLLEEPPDKMTLLMTSSQPSLLLPTITSRCQEVKFDPLRADDLEKALTEYEEVDPKQAAIVVRLASGSYRKACELLDEDMRVMQDHALEFFRKSVQNQYIQIEYVEEILGKLQRDSKKIKDLLSLLMIWLRDAQIYKETEGGHTFLVHSDQADVLNNFVSKFPDADLHNAIIAIEDALGLLARNVQINLILIVLLNKLRRFVRS